MSKECFNCKKQIPIEEFSKHELECNSTFYKNEMENLIPCEKCDTLIPFEEYNNHLNLCGFDTPIFYFPIPNLLNQNPVENDIAQDNTDEENPTEDDSTENPTEDDSTENPPENQPPVQMSPEVLLENINLLIQNNTNIINYLNTIGPQVDTYEQLSELDENKVRQGIALDKISKTVEREIDCPICFDKCKKINVLKCNHEICYECAEEWFEENAKCPICNIDFSEN